MPAKDLSSASWETGKLSAVNEGGLNAFDQSEL